MGQSIRGQGLQGFWVLGVRMDGWYFLLGIKIVWFTFANFLISHNIMMVELGRDMCKWVLANFGVLLYDDDDDVNACSIIQIIVQNLQRYLISPADEIQTKLFKAEEKD